MGSSKLTFIFTLRASSTMLETRTTCNRNRKKRGHPPSRVNFSELLTLWAPIYKYKFSKLISIHFLKKCVQRIWSKIKSFFTGDHFIYSHNLVSWQSMDIVRRKLMMVTKRVIHTNKKESQQRSRVLFEWVDLYSTANDLQIPNRPQNEPQMVLDRKWSREK